MEVIASHRVFDGTLRRVRHASKACACDMTFAVYLPPQAQDGPVPALYWLSGLTCTDENFSQKAGAYRIAAELGMAIIAPDTSPRGTDLPGEHDSYDLGSGAGFYINATQSPWSDHYQMFEYVTAELPRLVETNFPVSDVRGISGHSMGGHGALVCHFRNPGFYRSVSAFAPICNPSGVPWGEKAFSAYLGDDRESWKEWDATCLVGGAQERTLILVDQGTADEFLEEQLRPEALEHAAATAGYPLELRYQEGYDHSYYFIASFIEDHLQHHARSLGLGVAP